MKSTTKKMTTKEDLQTKSIDILVVDDSIASLRLLTEILTKEDLKVRPVREPQLAFMSACAQPPNLILLDVNMPDMSGFELCRRLKADERTHSVPIIFVSAMDDLRERLMGFEAGAVDYITKPIQEAEVLARVNTHLKLRNTQLHLEKLVAERTADLNALLQERTQALIMAEAQIDTLFENSPLGIGLSTFDGKIVAVNQALLDIMRVSKEELLLRNVTDFYVDPAERQTLIAAMLESGF
ncbi:MAG: response regulator, partial [Anaerolineae bacterium]|nr:response regulator [Anaerolineae bacterium]